VRSISASALFWNVRTSLAWALAVVAFVYFAVTDANFLNEGNLYALMQIFSTLVLVATGLAIVMIAAEFDLSIAGVFPLAALIAVKSADHLGVVAAMALAIAVGAAFGLVNGFMTGKLRIPSLAVTVATMVLSIGIGYAVTHSDLVKMTNYDASLRLTERVFGIFSIVSLVQLGLAILALIYMRVSWRGRYVYAVGSDAGRARASGLPVTATVVFAFVTCAVFASVAGSLQGLSLATGQAGSDDAFLLKAATAALIGGVALTGGRGSLTGVLGGALLLSLLTNGLGLAGVDSPVIQLVNGVVLIAVVLVDRPINRLIDRRLRGELAEEGSS
jgi:ribose transport system permease protein